MNTAVDLFKAPLPAHVINAKSRTMLNMGGGISGGGFGNRISLRNSKFRFMQSGSDVGTTTGTLEVVVFAMASQVQRMYYAGAYNPDSKDKPTCFSMDGKAPSDESPQKQSNLCATCKQNVKGSGRMPNTKACAYKKRVVVLSPEDLEGPMYALDVSGMSMFGEQNEAANLYSFKGYYEKLVAHNMDIAAIVTRLSFNDKASVPVLHFTPVRALTAEEFETVQKRMEDEEVDKVLADMTNETETDEAVTTTAATPQARIQQQPQAEVGSSKDHSEWQAKPEQKHQGVGGLVQDVAPSVKKGFPSAKGNGQQQQATAKQVQNPVPQGKPLELDLDKLVNFDD